MSPEPREEIWSSSSSEPSLEGQLGIPSGSPEAEIPDPGSESADLPAGADLPEGADLPAEADRIRPSDFMASTTFSSSSGEGCRFLSSDSNALRSRSVSSVESSSGIVFSS